MAVLAFFIYWRRTGSARRGAPERKVTRCGEVNVVIPASGRKNERATAYARLKLLAVASL